MKNQDERAAKELGFHRARNRATCVRLPARKEGFPHGAASMDYTAHTMKTIDRRTFLSLAASSVLATRLNAYGQDAARVSLAIPAEARGPQMPADFFGLSYEVEQLEKPAFFSAQNTGLIRQFKAIAANGVLRLGGNTSEFGWWKPAPDAPEPDHPQTRVVAGEPQPRFYAVTPQAVRNLADFLDATGWTCIYGIGMGTNTPERAAVEAEFAAKTLGARLQYFQLGNEVDLFSSHLRDPKTWNVKTYLAEWLAMARAIAARVPEAQFGMPDVASRIDWLTEIAASWPSIANPPRVVTLTHHYYFGGPATNPAVNIPNLLQPATMAHVQQMANLATAAAAKMGLRVRMTEGNTCYRGGKPGVSDVFAAALWSADYALLLASNSYTGINLHGGTGSSVANSVGGFLPGDDLLRAEGATPAQIATHPHPFYTPIATFGAEYALEPVACGLKFAAAFAGATLFSANLTTQLQAAGVDATAYAARMRSGQTSLIVLNKDAQKDLALDVKFAGAEGHPVTIERFHAPALDSREAHLTAEKHSDRLKDGSCAVAVPRASGLRVTIG